MSGIVETPYVNSYNSMQEVLARKTPLQYPPRQLFLTEDDGSNLVLKRGATAIYQGNVDAPNLVEVVENRVQREFKSIGDFWNACMDEKTNTLRLNGIARILNSNKLDFTLPPPGTASPLKVSVGGMIVLEEGNLVLRGVKTLSQNEALSLVLVNGTKVTFENSLSNHVNVAAPKAEIIAKARFDLCGTLAVSEIPSDPGFPGGTLNYRESQDPTRASSLEYLKVKIEEKDSFWHE